MVHRGRTGHLGEQVTAPVGILVVWVGLAVAPSVEAREWATAAVPVARLTMRAPAEATIRVASVAEERLARMAATPLREALVRAALLASVRGAPRARVQAELRVPVRVAAVAPVAHRPALVAGRALATWSASPEPEVGSAFTAVNRGSHVVN